MRAAALVVVAVVVAAAAAVVLVERREEQGKRLPPPNSGEWRGFPAQVGHVRDENGRPLEGASIGSEPLTPGTEVTLMGLAARTDGRYGNYNIFEPGTYSVSASKPGYSSSTHRVLVKPGRRAVVDFALSPSTMPSAVAFWELRRGIATTPIAITTTDDGGRTWTFRHRARRPSAPAVAPGGSAWALAGRWLLHSSDYGRTWRADRIDRRFDSIDFVNGGVGWATVDAARPNGDGISTLFATADGGRSWRRLRHPCPGWYVAAHAALVTPAHGWIACAGQLAAGHQLKALYETRDKGRTWALRAGPRAFGAGYVNGIGFGPGRFSLMVNTLVAGVYASRDGAKSWSPVRFGAFNDGLFASVTSPTLGHALIGANRHGMGLRLVRTTDAGRSWTRIRSWED